MAVYAQAADRYFFDDLEISSSNPTKLLTNPLDFQPEKGIWVKADPTNIDVIRISGSNISGTNGWPLVKGEEMLFDIANVNNLYALAVNNNDVLHIFVR